MTPKATRSPQWKMGSGFDGFTLEASGVSKESRPTRSRKAGHPRNPRLLDRSLPKLDLSTSLSPTFHSFGQRDVPKGQKDQSSPHEAWILEPIQELGTAVGAVNSALTQTAVTMGGKAISVQNANLNILPGEPVKSCQSGTAGSQPHVSQSKGADTSQVVLEASKGEQNDWLKRKMVSFVVTDEDEEELQFVHRPRTSVNASGRWRSIERGRLDSYFKDATQAQHATNTDLQSSVRSGQIRPTPEHPISGPKQVFLQSPPRAEQQRRRDQHDAEIEGSDSEDAFLRSSNPPEPPPASNIDSDILTRGRHPQHVSMPNAMHCIQGPRTSEVPESQERLQESVDIDRVRTASGGEPFYISETALDSGSYFSKAIQHLESPEKMSHTVIRRRSRREPNEDAGRSPMFSKRQRERHHVSVAPFVGEQRVQEQDGSALLGVTARLKRRMSNAPFRPPFKEHS